MKLSSFCKASKSHIQKNQNNTMGFFLESARGKEKKYFARIFCQHLLQKCNLHTEKRGKKVKLFTERAGYLRIKSHGGECSKSIITFRGRLLYPQASDYFQEQMMALAINITFYFLKRVPREESLKQTRQILPVKSQI